MEENITDDGAHKRLSVLINEPTQAVLRKLRAADMSVTEAVMRGIALLAYYEHHRGTADFSTELDVTTQPEPEDVHAAAAELLMNVKACLHPAIDDYGVLRDLGRDLLDSRGAVDGAWGRKTARVLLQLPPED